MKKKWIPVAFLSIAGAVSAAFFLTAHLIEDHIANTGVLSKEKGLIEKEAGLSFEYGTATYDMFRGLVLSDVRITEKKRVIFQSGQAVFQIPVLELLRGNLQLSRLTLFDGTIHLGGEENPRKRMEKLISFLKNTSLDLAWKNLQIDGLRTNADFPAHTVKLAGSLTVRNREMPSLHLAIHFKDEEVFQLHGSWKSVPAERLFVQITDMPVGMPDLWTRNFPYLPLDADVQWHGGHFNAEGSIDLTDEGYAFHLRGDFQNLQFSVQSTDFRVSGLAGTFDQMIVGSYAEGMLHSRLRVRSPEIEHAVEVDRDPATGVDHARFTGKLRLQKNERLQLPGFIQTATVDYRIGLQQRRLRTKTTFIPDLQITIQNLTFDFGNSWKSLAPITVDEATISGSHRISLLAGGRIGSVPFRFTSSSQPDVYRNAAHEMIFRHQTDFQLDIDEVSIEDTIRRTGNVLADLREYVNSPVSVRSEDFGPVWENKFFQNPAYRKYFEQARVQGRIRIQNIVDAAPDMPTTLELRFRHRIPTTELLLVRPDGFDLSGHYRIHYDAALPSHDALLEAHYQGGLYRTQLFTDAETEVQPLQSLDFKYTFQAEGQYLADLYYKSLTALFLKAKHVPVQNDYRLDLLQRMADLKPRPLRYVDFDIQRHSSGSLFKPLVIRLEDSEIALSGNGEFNAYEGGRLRFTGYHKSGGQRNRFTIRIRPDRVWIPSS